MDESGVILCVFTLYVWFALRQYTNVELLPIYSDTVVVKGLKKLISILWISVTIHCEGLI